MDGRKKRSAKKKKAVVVKDGESIKPCRCTSITHQRITHKACPLNKNNLAAEKVGADTAVTWDPLVHDVDEEALEIGNTFTVAADKAAMLAGVVEGAEVYGEQDSSEDDSDSD